MLGPMVELRYTLLTYIPLEDEGFKRITVWKNASAFSRKSEELKLTFPMAV